MANDNILKYGVLRTRELIEIFFGARMVTTVRESQVKLGVTPTEIIGQNPSRIRYEIWVAPNVVPSNYLAIGSPAAVDRKVGAFFYTETQSQPPTFVRDWLTDGEGVCLPVSGAVYSVDTVYAYARETILTPAPVDELPLG